MEKANDQATNNGVTQHDEMNGEQVEDVDLDVDAQATERLTDSDPNKVKFTSIKMDGYSDKNGDARVDIRVAQASVGMGKEELMKYANEPYWVRLRMILFVLFWVSWVAMLVGAVAIIILAPRCPPAPRLEWHQKTTMYRVMTKAFKDSNGDGIGDLKGVTSKLDYFKSINVGTLLLSAFYAMAPNSEGIVNHTTIDSRFGTMSDFEELLKEMKNKDLKLVIDFNPNHSSDEHPWFKDSVDKKDPYTDFYVWADGAPHGDGKNLTAPNKWLSVNGDSSAWEWNEKRKQYYLHTFGKDQPDLNLRNEDVRNEVLNIMEFWLDKGVDGFKVTAASNLIEDGALREEPLGREKSEEGKPKYTDVNHIFTVGQPENLELFAEWRKLLNNHSESSGTYKVLLAEVSEAESLNSTMKYYGKASHPLADFPINVQLTQLRDNSTGLDLLNHIKNWLEPMPNGVWPNWQLGSEFTDRLAVRVGPELIDGMYMVAALAKGTPIVYYGDELGISYTPIQGNVNALNRSPMQWDSVGLAGFTNGTDTDVPLNPDFQQVNVEEQKTSDSSHLKIFTELLSLRNEPAVSLGDEEYPVVNDEIFSLLRVRKGSPGYLLVFNMGTNTTVTDFTGKSDFLPQNGNVAVRSLNIKDGPLVKNHKVELNNIVLQPSQAVVFSFVPVFKE